VAARERSLAPPLRGAFVPRAHVMDADDVRRAVWRMAHEIIEAEKGLDGVVLIGLRPVVPEAPSHVPWDLTDKTVVLVDDVLYTGRTVRAALNALADHGRARAVRLAVMVDRGHRELPIRPDVVGKNLPTRADELVDVGPDGVTIGDLLPAPASKT